MSSKYVYGLYWIVQHKLCSYMQVCDNGLDLIYTQFRQRIILLSDTLMYLFNENTVYRHVGAGQKKHCDMQL